MKTLSVLLIAVITIVSCSKEKTETVTVKFVTSGTEVTQFKFTTGSTISDKDVPFSGTQDTTVIVPKGTVLKLDSKANSNNLSGMIFVNDALVATGTDDDIDGDGKTNVKLEYSILK